jgi:hypothetical protein
MPQTDGEKTMLTFVIPTMWKIPDVLFRTLGSFHRIIDREAELLLIENDVAPEPFADHIYKDKRIKRIRLPQNIGVNPAWNLGVLASSPSNQLICFLNDDIHLNMVCLYQNAIRLMGEDPALGILAFHNGCLLPLDTFEWLNLDDDKLQPHYTTSRPMGYGFMMVVRKEDWRSMPYGLDIYYGDDLLSCRMDFIGRTKALLPIKAKGLVSVTSSAFSHRMDIEMPIFQKWYSDIQADNTL